MQEWTEKWTLMSHHASASRCDKQQLFCFKDFTIVVAIMPVVSSIDFENMEIIIKIPQTNTHFDVVVKSCSYL